MADITADSYELNELGNVIHGYSVYAGGICTTNEGDIFCCVNTGSISSMHPESESCAGGIVGVNYLGNIQNCYNTGTISAEINHAIGTYGGGIAGQSSAGRISNCYNVGMSARGILSDNFLTPTYVIDCYYLTSASDQGVGRSEPDYERIFAFSEEELRQQSTFSAFDFDQIWVMTENGPQLQ